MNKHINTKVNSRKVGNRAAKMLPPPVDRRTLQQLDRKETNAVEMFAGVVK